MPLPSVSDTALKEWAVAVKTLGQGEQIIVLRKGGIHRADKDFRFVHPEFLLFPTYEHQKAELIKTECHDTLRDTYDDSGSGDSADFTHFCQVTDKFELRDESDLDRISDFHIWTDDYARKRLHWRPKQPLTVALLRVYELQQTQSLPILPEYSGCKSWVELGTEVNIGNMTPVLDDAEYECQAKGIRSALAEAVAIA
ncbi:MAG: DUF1802 family protein [Dehalococcoidia bacterium]|nr:DUF1802 family protein [Dehalococcoidia bacterium]